MPSLLLKSTHPGVGSPAWHRTLIILFIGQLFTAVGFSSIFPFLPLYVQELGTSSGLSLEFLAGMVFSAQAITMAVASPFWGAIADRYGRKLMVERAMFGGAGILFLMAFVQNAEQLVILRAIQGLITGTIAAANAMVAAVAPRERIGYAMGLLQVGLGIGVALGPVIGGLIADVFGYAAAFYVTSALLLLAGILVWWGAEEHFEKPVRPERKTSGFLDQWKQVVAAPGVFTTFCLRFISQLGRMLIIPIAPLFIQTLLNDSAHLNTFTGLVTGVSAATTTLSAVYLGRLGDRRGHRMVLIASAASAASIYALHLLVTTGWQLLALQALVGVALGGVVPTISALLARFTQKGSAGAVYGLDNSVDAAGRSAAPLIGAVVASWFGLQAAFGAAALLFLGLCFLAIYRLPRP
jgi:DHA1 family multidrug resistance protein-like MFS transporter